jgi:hypothetical protein
MGPELMEHQEEAVSKLASGKVLHGGVGSGKSLTAIAYYMRNEAPKDIYVITTAKKRDSLEWLGEAIKFGISDLREISSAGKITVDSWNNIGNYVGVEDAFFIFDEQRVVGSGAWVKAFVKIAKANNWILLSATPGDTWLDYVPVFIANGFYRNATEFKREHCVYAPYSKFPKIIRYLDVRTLEKYRNIVLVEMPFIKHTERIIEYVDCSYDPYLMDLVVKQRWNPYADGPIKDVAELFRCMRRVDGEDRTRFNAVLSLMDKHPKLIIFYNFNYELDILRELRDVVPLAEWNGHKKQPIPNTDRWVYLVQYVAGAEGWNCIETDAMIYYTLTYSYKNHEQGMGRIDRLDTPFTLLYYYILMSNSVSSRGAMKSLAAKENFNQRKFAREEMGLEV